LPFLDIQLELYQLGYQSYAFYEEQCDAMFDMVVRKRALEDEARRTACTIEVKIRRKKKSAWSKEHVSRKTPEERKALNRKDYLARRETKLAQAKTEEHRERERAYYAANKEKIRQQRAERLRKKKEMS